MIYTQVIHSDPMYSEEPLGTKGFARERGRAFAGSPRNIQQQQNHHRGRLHPASSLGVDSEAFGDPREGPSNLVAVTARKVQRPMLK